MPTLMTIVATILSFYFLSKSLKTLPIGTAYAIWTSLGAAGTALCGCFFFGESLSILKIVFILVIIGGVSGLKFVS
jgi:quaternary ammonium compound-resistance protein SugE